MTQGILGYNSANDRYGILVCDLWEVDGLHCGDCLEVWNYETETWTSTRIEMRWKNEWYLVGTPYSGTALEGSKVRIS